jgi:hypothetical protein
MTDRDEVAESLRVKLLAAQSQLAAVREAFDVWQNAPNTPDMNMALCASLRRALLTPAPSPGAGGCK